MRCVYLAQCNRVNESIRKSNSNIKRVSGDNLSRSICWIKLQGRGHGTVRIFDSLSANLIQFYTEKYSESSTNLTDLTDFSRCFTRYKFLFGYFPTSDKCFCVRDSNKVFVNVCDIRFKTLMHLPSSIKWTKKNEKYDFDEKIDPSQLILYKFISKLKRKLL